LLNLHADADSVLEHFRVNKSLLIEPGVPWMETDVNVFHLKENSYFVPNTPTLYHICLS